MTKDEIIQELLKKGVIAVIKDSYYITSKYEDCFSQSVKTIETAPKDLEPAAVTGPVSVLNSKGKARYTAFMNECDIPFRSPDGKYLLRGYTKEAEKILNDILDSPKVDIISLINAVKLYYKNIEMPKNFKNLCAEWTILDVYNMYIEGERFEGDSQKHNETWG